MSSEAQARIAIAVARLAVERTGLQDPKIPSALDEVARGKRASQRDKKAIEALVTALDERAWDLQEEDDYLEASQGYTQAFSEARAAHAAFFAVGEDPAVAVIEAVYEAGIAIDDFEEIARVVENLVGSDLA